MNQILRNKIEHFSQLEKEWNTIKKKINSKIRITEKKKCPICNKTKNLKIIFKKKGLNFVKCGCYNSDHIFINPVIKSSILDKHFTNSISWKTWAKKVLIKKNNDKKENKKFFESLKKISKFKKKIINVLDIGCSTGNFLKYCDKNFKWNLNGIEPSYESFKVAKKQCGKRIKIENCNLDSYKTNKKFDLITFWASLEYIQDINKALKKIKKISNKNSIILVFVSGNSNSLIMRTLREKCVGFIFNRTHYFNPKSLKIFLKKYGYKELYKKSYYSEIDIVENYMNYNNPYDRRADLEKSNLFNKKSKHFLNKLIKSKHMGYKFLAIFKKI
jgi:trans-aconitate methyltransferase